ncbi:nucleotidyltransferase [Streptomyces sp. V4-01]|uniref:Nucleotidyltransferase n=1 Tax=Actinacidiphila polyblastidii TaxID=3110430 RepID=A0ABU7P763_9ACTN|nr:nucleotidyltransferase [Streptomyces sp. V4-01]
MSDAVHALLNRFLGGLREAVPLTALWAHGSLALGDFQPGRSDLDMIAVVAAPVTGPQRTALGALHARLDAEEPLAAKLHCSYVVVEAIGDPAVSHLTWAHRELTARPVTEVSRRELHTGDHTLFGPPPRALLPEVSDAELAAFVRTDLRTFWLPATAMPVRWLQDVWVDLGLLTVARATVTLDDGRLITKGEALDVLARLGAPPAVVADIRARRYGRPLPLPAHRRLRRAQAARAFARARIKATLTGASGAS